MHNTLSLADIRDLREIADHELNFDRAYHRILTAQHTRVTHWPKRLNKVKFISSDLINALRVLRADLNTPEDPPAKGPRKDA